jgi:hypothetical protein
MKFLWIFISHVIYVLPLFSPSPPFFHISISFVITYISQFPLIFSFFLMNTPYFLFFSPIFYFFNILISHAQQAWSFSFVPISIKIFSYFFLCQWSNIMLFFLKNHTHITSKNKIIIFAKS